MRNYILTDKRNGNSGEYTEQQLVDTFGWTRLVSIIQHEDKEFSAAIS